MRTKFADDTKDKLDIQEDQSLLLFLYCSDD